MAAAQCQLLKLYTQIIPNYSGLTQGAANPGYARYYWHNPDTLNKDQDILRVDYALSSKFNTFFRWVNDDQNEMFGNGVWAWEPFPVQPQFRPKPGSSWSWNIVNTFSPTLASETILSYNHQSQSLECQRRSLHRERQPVAQSGSLHQAAERPVWQLQAERLPPARCQER